jgi:hypothetical protein
MNASTMGSSSSDDRSPDEIERDIRHTRDEVSSTLDAIQSKLTPGQMMDQALNYMRSSLPADFGRNLNESVRNNPIPVALVGIGLAWMMMSGRRGSMMGSSSMGSSMDASSMGSSSLGSMQSSSMHSSSMSDSSSGGMMQGMRDSAQHMADRTREMTGSARERLSSTAAGARDSIASTAAGARDRMADIAHRSRDQMSRARAGMSQVIDEQPVVVGALGVALGAMLGAALPSTRQEDQLMGEMRDDLMARAGSMARDYADRAAGQARNVSQQAAERMHRAVDEQAARAEA